GGRPTILTKERVLLRRRERARSLRRAALPAGGADPRRRGQPRRPRRLRDAADPATLYSCGHRFTDDHWCLPRKELPESPDELLDLPGCSISSTLVRRAVLERCGLLDPIFEIYYESADLCFRARAAGFRIACCADAVTYNEARRATGSTRCTTASTS